MTKTKTAAVILSAGLGTRMKSATPKVLHPLAGRPMLSHLLDTLSGLGLARTTIVIGEGMDAVAEAAASSGADAATPYVRLTWQALDDFRAHKKTTPFSGTTLAHDAAGRALWFSKNLIPAIRKEDALRQQGDMSPVCRHIGLYAYRLPALRKYVSLPEGHYEKLEGLEQLRFLENGMSVQCVEVESDTIAIPGIDAPEDVALAERLIATHGDPLKD